MITISAQTTSPQVETARELADEIVRQCLLTMSMPGMPARQCDGQRSLASSEVQHAVSEVRRGIATCLRTRIRRDITAGLLPPATRPDALVGLVMAVAQGMSVLARDGASRASLLSTVELAMSAWPLRAAIG